MSALYRGALSLAIIAHRPLPPSLCAPPSFSLYCTSPGEGPQGPTSGVMMSKSTTFAEIGQKKAKTCCETVFRQTRVSKILKR